MKAGRRDRCGAAFVAVALAWSLAGSTVAQEACLRPVPPEAVRPPEDDPEFRAFLGDEYETYLLAMQDYLNCLGREHETASAEVSRVMARWLLWFGDDAVLHEAAPEAEQDGIRPASPASSR